MKEIDHITVSELAKMSETMDGLVKADVDVAQGRLVVDMELHADGEAYLLEQGSQQADVWGINLYPDQYGTEGFIEYDSMINIRPRQGNRSRDVLDVAARSKIAEIVGRVVTNG